MTAAEAANAIRLPGIDTGAAPTGGVIDAVSGDRVSARQLGEKANAYAHALRECGIGAGDRVALMDDNGPSFVAALFGIWRAGGCAVLIDDAWTAPEIERVVTFARPVVIVAGNGVVIPEMPDAVPVLRAAQIGAGGGSPLLSAVADDTPALVLFTSGTTGRPRGVVHSFASLAARIRFNHHYIGKDVLQVALCPLSLQFGHGLIGNTLTPLLAGGEVILMPRPDFAAWGRLGACIDRYGVSFISSVPSMWPLIIELSPPPARGALRRVHVGSAPLSAPMWEAIIAWSGSRDVVNAWGITETANWISGASALEGTPEDGCVGRPWGGDVAVRRDDGALKATGEGELLARSSALMQGYLYESPDDGPWDRGWLETGDLGRIDESGCIYLLGRRGLAINTGGTKVQPEEIEALLERHPAVRDACVFALRHELLGEQVAAAVVLDEPLAEETLRQWCAQRLRAAAVPQRWFFPSALPRTPRGKLDRQAVRAAVIGCASPSE